LRDAPHEDPFGTGERVGLLDWERKGRLPAVAERVVRYLEHLGRLDAIEVLMFGDAAWLSDQEKRVLRIHARRLDGRVIRIKDLTGGLSGVRTLQVTVMDSRGATRSRVVAKSGALEAVGDERAQETVDVLIRFDGYTGAYVMHCHQLEHEGMGMMTNFVVE
jgi:hypothetical protein